jgi:hypothetical protein
MYAKELGMGIEPIYNSSAGCRLDDSATPAPMQMRVYAETNKNVVGSNIEMLGEMLLLCSRRLPPPF